MSLPVLRFHLDDVQIAADEWGANCGPVAIAAMCGLTLCDVRRNLGDFETKRYTNPTLMWATLRGLGVRWTLQTSRAPNEIRWPRYGLARVQWEGPWTKPGVPMAARYRHTHWVGSVLTDDGGHSIFDVNCMCVGGFVSNIEWTGSVVPWLLRECEPKADGHWHLTHSVEIDAASLRSRVLPKEDVSANQACQTEARKG